MMLNRLLVKFAITFKRPLMTKINLLLIMRLQIAAIAKTAKDISGSDKITAVADSGCFAATDIAKYITNGITPHISGNHDNVTLCIPIRRRKLIAHRSLATRVKMYISKNAMSPYVLWVKYFTQEGILMPEALPFTQTPKPAKAVPISLSA
jgi:hypothetical protein